MNINIYKTVLFIINIVLAVCAVYILLSLKKYIKKHQNETVGENEKQIKSYARKFLAIAILNFITVIVAAIIWAIDIFKNL